MPYTIDTVIPSFLSNTVKAKVVCEHGDVVAYCPTVVMAHTIARILNRPSLIKTISDILLAVKELQEAEPLTVGAPSYIEGKISGLLTALEILQAD